MDKFIVQFIKETLADVTAIKETWTELKNIDTYLTEISRANSKLSKTQLSQIGSDSFDIANKYGKPATAYLSAMQAASKAGYENAASIAELSVALQSAGNITEDVANKYISAIDKAYGLNGAVAELTKIFDGANKITNENAGNIQELAEGLSVAGSPAVSLGIDAREATAALGTMMVATQQSGSEVAEAFKAILLYIRQISDEEKGIDAEGLTAYEKACNALNVKLKETHNGVQSLRDPMEVLKELSAEYRKLGEHDVKKTNLLSSVGGNSTQLDALLRQWDTYEKMSAAYSNGIGSMAQEAAVTASSWEGSTTILSNNWTKLIGTLANQDAVIGTVNALSGLLDGITKLTDKIGILPPALAGISASLGKGKSTQRFCPLW